MATAQRVFVKTDNSLYEDYVFVDYIQSNGYQYIDTGFVPNKDTKVEISAQVLTQQSQWLYGARYSNGSRAFACGNFPSSNYARFDYNNTKVQSSSYIKAFGTVQHTIIQDKNKIYVDGTLKRTLSVARTFTCPNTLWIFSLNDYSATSFVPEVGAGFKLFYMKIWDNGILVRDYYPCYNQSTGEIGLWDNVAKGFVPNSGEQPFIKGIDVQSPEDIMPPPWKTVKNVYVQHVPNNIKFVDYIQSNGNQYIDTGFDFNNNTKIEICLQKMPGAGDYVCGGRYSNTALHFSLMDNQTDNCLEVHYERYTLMGYTAPPNLDTNIHTIIQDKTKLYFDGELKHTFSAGDFSAGASLWILAMHTGSNPFVAGEGLSCKLYYIKIWDNGTLVRDYYPCYNQSTGEIGLWDNVAETMVLNSGTTPFTKSDDSDPYSMGNKLRRWKACLDNPKVKVNGTW